MEQRKKEKVKQKRSSADLSLLAIDIGNTAVSCALAKGNEIKKIYHCQVDKQMTVSKKEVALLLKRIHKLHKNISGVIICSVVPRLEKIVKGEIIKTFGLKASVVGEDLKVPMKNRYRYPKQVGQDRLVCAYAVKQLYGQPAVVIDFGTAITFDVVNRKGEYEGGIIVPGIRLSAESLFNKAALLPEVRNIHVPKSLVGKTTSDSILSGLFYGYGAMSCGLIDMLSKGRKKNPKVIVTGGYTKLMKKFISAKVSAIDPHLVFKGMLLLYKDSHLGS